MTSLFECSSRTSKFDGGAKELLKASFGSMTAEDEEESSEEEEEYEDGLGEEREIRCKR